MSISSVKTGTIGDSLLAGNAGYDPAATFLIQRVAGTGASNTITFSSIPQNYKNLQIRWIARSTFATASAVNINTKINADTGANYAYHYLSGNGSAVTAAGSASVTEMTFPFMVLYKN
jgi:hypothetical protein